MITNLSLNRIIKVVPYDNNWLKIFEEESFEIKKLFGDILLDVHHVGSTAIPGVFSKPIIDIVVVIKNDFYNKNHLKPHREIKDYINKKMEGIGYSCKGEYNIPMRLYFNDKNSDDSFHVHLYREGHPEIDLNLIFKDYLISNPNIREEYSNIKKDILKDPSSQEKTISVLPNYTLRKGDFIRQVLKKAGFNKNRILKCNDETEIKFCDSFKEEYSKENNIEYIPIKFDLLNHSHLCLYKGFEIIGYAYIEFLKDSSAKLHIFKIVEEFQNTRIEFFKLINQWLTSLDINNLNI